MSKFVNVVVIAVETEKGRFLTHAVAGDKTTYLKKNCDRYAKAKARSVKAAVIFYECTLLTRVPVVNAYQMCMDYKNNELRVA